MAIPEKPASVVLFSCCGGQRFGRFSRFPAKYSLAQLRRHQRSPGLLRLSQCDDAGTGCLREGICDLRSCLYDRRSLCSVPLGNHYRHVSDIDWFSPYAVQSHTARTRETIYLLADPRRDITEPTTVSRTISLTLPEARGMNPVRMLTGKTARRTSPSFRSLITQAAMNQVSPVNPSIKK